MKAISYTKARSNLAYTMEEVIENHAPIIITRQEKKPVVLISLEDYEAIEETLYLMRNPYNAKKLMESVKQFENGEFEEMELIEDED